MTYHLKDGREVQVVLDVWEGQPVISTDSLRAGDVAGIIIRVNSISGGHHMDDLFPVAWTHYSEFPRVPYFIYNPWATGATNYTWIRDHLPPEVRCFMADIEVKKTDLSPVTYATEVQKFIDAAKLNYNTKIYTGAWFLTYLSTWPTNVGYWWAQYPYSIRPANPIAVTWEQLHNLVALQKWPPVNAAQCPGPLELWQCSGDRLYLPGQSGKCADISLFLGTREELINWFSNPVITPAPLTLEQRIKNVEDELFILKQIARENGWDV